MRCVCVCVCVQYIKHFHVAWELCIYYILTFWHDYIYLLQEGMSRCLLVLVSGLVLGYVANIIITPVVTSSPPFSLFLNSYSYTHYCIYAFLSVKTFWVVILNSFLKCYEINCFDFSFMLLLFPSIRTYVHTHMLTIAKTRTTTITKKRENSI